MRLIGISVLAAILVFTASQAYGQGVPDVDRSRDQMNDLIDRVHNRVREAAEAATYVLEAELHRRQAEQMAALGQHQDALAQLQSATDLVNAPSAIQSDLLFQGYVSRLLSDADGVNRRPEREDHDAVYTARGVQPTFTFIEEMLKENSLPPELVAIVMVESAGDPMALSAKGARGLWQLMPDTARRYGLRVDDHVDERIDVLKSTHAAVRYLRDLYETFKDWPLALAAYNAGENRIQKIKDATGMRRFADMAAKGLLPLETAQYVPAVLNAMSIRR